jgi:hypothetical protein
MIDLCDASPTPCVPTLLLGSDTDT